MSFGAGFFGSIYSINKKLPVSQCSYTKILGTAMLLVSAMVFSPAFSAWNISNAVVDKLTLQKKRSVSVSNKKALEISPPEIAVMRTIFIQSRYSIWVFRFLFIAVYESSSVKKRTFSSLEWSFQK